MKKRKTIIAMICIFVLWIAIGAVDYIRVHSFEKPVFCVGTDLASDGGSGKYIGLGYSFDIKGNFMPEDEFPGVTKWKYYLFGIEVKTQIRD